MANYTVIPKDLDITSLPDNKTLALDEDEKLSFSESTFSIFGELILKNLINSYENNLLDLTYDFAQADSFHIENGINGTVNTTNDLGYQSNGYINLGTSSTDTAASGTIDAENSSDVVFNVKILKTGFISYIRTNSNTSSNYALTVTIRDSQNNTIAQKTNSGSGTTQPVSFGLSDYSRLLKTNETVTVTLNPSQPIRKVNNFSATRSSFEITNQNFYYKNSGFIYQYYNASTGNLNVSVSDVSDTDSVALFIDSDKPNLITPTYNTSGGQLNSIDFDFSDTETINFYGYVLYIYK